MRRITLQACALAAMSLLGGGVAGATPPVVTPEPGGLIRVDIGAGEWWECEGYSLAPPFLQVVPDFYIFELGPTPIYLRYAPGTPAWVSCVGTGEPFYWVGQIVTAGQ
ncbi:hypothetical protein [Antrihabitans stalactiti]|uniref:Secreted protein n=1 Tax=Antrihabitans stalactiti TaxID=2584121 RepID=A0A848KI49_9NOCA|nr:hypothetical protein [Antrihabitans stalactiti]NMN96734.1 hypothetical protein [Antrihabitans stalactiti]